MEKTLTPHLWITIIVTANSNRFETIFVIPTPITPKCNDIGSLETSTVSNTIDKKHLMNVIIN